MAVVRPAKLSASPEGTNASGAVLAFPAPNVTGFMASP